MKIGCRQTAEVDGMCASHTPVTVRDLRGWSQELVLVSSVVMRIG